jgi:hypothetical protein
LFTPGTTREHGREKKSRQDPNDRAENGDTIHNRHAAPSPEIPEISHGYDPENRTKILVHGRPPSDVLAAATRWAIAGLARNDNRFFREKDDQRATVWRNFDTAIRRSQAGRFRLVSAEQGAIYASTSGFYFQNI